MLTIIASTTAQPDVSETRSAALVALAEAVWTTPLRETTRNDELGQPEYRVRVVEITDPDNGKPLFVVDYMDPADYDYEGTDDQAEAEARYEEFVRQWLESPDLDADGCVVPFDSTDIPDVPGYQGEEPVRQG